MTSPSVWNHLQTSIAPWKNSWSAFHYQSQPFKQSVKHCDKSCCLLHLILPWQSQTCGNSVAKHLQKTHHPTCTNSWTEMRQHAPDLCSKVHTYSWERSEVDVLIFELWHQDETWLGSVHHYLQDTDPPGASRQSACHCSIESKWLLCECVFTHLHALKMNRTLFHYHSYIGGKCWERKKLYKQTCMFLCFHAN